MPHPYMVWTSHQHNGKHIDAIDAAMQGTEHILTTGLVQHVRIDGHSLSGRVNNCPKVPGPGPTVAAVLLA